MGRTVVMMPRVFLLSPANCSGRRAGHLLSDKASSSLAHRLRNEGAPLGDVFTFMSGLYFRGKLTYALRFARCGGDPTVVGCGVFVITPGAGLRSPETLVTLDAVERFSRVDVSIDQPAYRRPLEGAAARLAEAAPDAEFVLLGSIATPKYVDVLSAILGRRLLFPAAFIGRGDMSRGGLLLRQAASGVELDYIPVVGAARHGPRPPRLTPAGLRR